MTGSRPGTAAGRGRGRHRRLGVGVRWSFRVKPHSGDPQALLGARPWLEATGRPGLQAPPPARLMISAIREHGDGVVAQAREVAESSC